MSDSNSEIIRKAYQDFVKRKRTRCVCRV